SAGLLFRGVIQTSLNRSIHAAMRWRGWRLPLGTLFAAVLFGLFHLVNIGFQPLAATLDQVAVGIALGLVIGVLYDRTGNLIGAGLFHSVARTFRARRSRFLPMCSLTGRAETRCLIQRGWRAVAVLQTTSNGYVQPPVQCHT